MNPDQDDFADLEATLRQLHPAKVSRDLQARIRENTRPRSASWRMVVGMAAMVALCASMYWLNTRSSVPAAGSRQISAVFDSTEPTYLAYQHAACVSDQALFDLLDVHARKLLPRTKDQDLYRKGS